MITLLYYARQCALIFFVAVLISGCADRSMAEYLDLETFIALDIGAKTTTGGPEQQVYFTVADLRVDGQSVPGFKRVTVDLAGLDRMKGKPLYDGQIDNQHPQLLELVLDGNTDAEGAGPGCYLVRDGQKYPIAVGAHHTLRMQSNLLRPAPSDTTHATVVVDLSRALVYDQARGNYRLAANNYYRRYLELVQEQPDAELLGGRMEK